ncbi:SDR family oxidoreductase [Kineococcus rhizosphaerae]|uniref:Nucleoside-diphosphate-sugar epimerase n=1 Tax=Kineococcus rhizosphaerae TaxID=559628 RepID=A0A2T0R673_9ACTN|nr:SDR family oxidoreductase [Kineococcus rhizosphaerae]PRY16620.1 nucleoside-diphosphate-sugar epimerase [Kineococcus rhizosphaerae]
MRVFITGASGWIGSHTVDEFLAAGHEVLGLARSDASAATLEAKGAEVLRGDLDDLDSLREGAASTDGTVHLANKHDFANPAVSNAAERAAVQTIADTLEGSGRPFLVASGHAGIVEGRAVTEDDVNPHVGPDAMRGGSERLALDYADRGVRAIAARFAPTVHGAGDHGFVAALVAGARAAGQSGYVGDGSNEWSAVHVTDAARAVRLAVEGAPAGTRLHVVAEEGIATRDIATAIGEGLGLPVVPVDPAEATTRIGWIGFFFGMHLAATSDKTRALLGWHPNGPTLADDLPSYLSAPTA